MKHFALDRITGQLDDGRDDGGGMRDRAELLGGTLLAGSVEGGFRVRVWLLA